MANNTGTTTGIGLFDGSGGLLPVNQGKAIIFPSPSTKFRESTNAIEGKTWVEMDVSEVDTIVIIHEGKRVEIDRKDFLQKVGLEW